MSAITPDPEPDDRLVRAEAVLRDAPVPEGPAADVIARTRAALRTAANRPTFPISLEKTHADHVEVNSSRSSGSRRRAVVPRFVPRAEATVTFAEVAQKLHDAHTLSFRISAQMPGQKGPTTGREYYKDPGLVRTEFDGPPGGRYHHRHEPGQGPHARSVFQTRNAPGMETGRRFAASPARPGRKPGRAIAGHGRQTRETRRQATDRQRGGAGFSLEDDGLAWTVWVDPERKMPLVMETSMHFQDQDIPSTMSDFQIDPKLADSLFRLEPPQGYTLKKIDAPIVIGEQALVNLLRMYAESSGGVFPPTPLDRDAFRKQFPAEKFKDAADPRMVRLTQSLTASLAFLQFELKNAYGYKAEGVKLGDADKVLFWYRKKDAEKYRADFRRSPR